MSDAQPYTDRRLLLWLGGLVLLVIVAVSLIAPATAANDPRPSSYNTAPGGAKAAFLTLEGVGRSVDRLSRFDQLDRSLEELSPAAAAQTTLILAEPMYSALDKDRLAAGVRGFLEHGGHLLTTGIAGALLLPGGAAEPGHRLNALSTPEALCYTTPEGPGELAAAGHVEMQAPARWSGKQTAVHVEQRCGADAVVIRLPVGPGEAVWWSSASPLTNAELHNDPDLKLLLASLGPGRRVLFDESLQQPPRSKWTAVGGLPLWALLAQAALVFALLVFSFSRRHGPVRGPVTVPRSSPVEFAVNMGDLYERGGVTNVAVGAARRRLGRVLVRDGGLPQPLAVSHPFNSSDPDTVAAALHARFGGDWTGVSDHLRAVEATADADPSPRAALALVRALYGDAGRIQAAAHPASGPASAATQESAALQ